ncbi:MAG: M23 family metallopeptidase, partial [Pseudomonadota bacterium]
VNEQQGREMSQFLDLQQKLENEKRRLVKVARKMVDLKKKIMKEEKNISKNQASKKVYLSSLEKSLKRKKSDLQKLKGMGQKALKNSEFKNLSLLFGTQFFDRKGKLVRPYNGFLIQGFGLNKALSLDSVELIHKGHFYQKGDETRVQSVADGRVRLIRNVPGYGQTVIIDHGGRYYSIYSNLYKTSVKKNQQIRVKDEIGHIGHSHLQFGEGLYFEIRHFSEPQDPGKWLVKEQKKLATL